MAKKALGAVTAPETLNQIALFVDVLQEQAVSGGIGTRPHGRDDTGRASARTALGTALGSAADLGKVQVYGVRDAKDSLSKILNDASSGDLAFIEAGRGGAVVVMSTNVLAGVITSLEGKRDLTLAEALGQLPYRPVEMVRLMARGRAPRRGLLSGAQAVPRPTASDEAGVD